jgi:hypothetical protein
MIILVVFDYATSMLLIVHLAIDVKCSIEGGP